MFVICILFNVFVFFGFLMVEILISKHCIIDLLLSILSRPMLLGLEFAMLAGMRELRLVVVVVVRRGVFVCCTRADASLITLGVGFRRRPEQVVFDQERRQRRHLGFGSLLREWADLLGRCHRSEFPSRWPYG